jgi:hypothetical protein
MGRLRLCDPADDAAALAEPLDTTARIGATELTLTGARVSIEVDGGAPDEAHADWSPQR